MKKIIIDEKTTLELIEGGCRVTINGNSRTYKKVPKKYQEVVNKNVEQKEECGKKEENKQFIPTQLMIRDIDLLENKEKVPEVQPITEIGRKEGLTETDKKVMQYFNEIKAFFFDKIKNMKKSFLVKNALTPEIKEKVKFIENNFDTHKITMISNKNAITLYYGNVIDKENYYRLCQVSKGNRKLVANSMGQGFFIFNIQGFITCNGKTNQCMKYCYNNCRCTNNDLNLKLSNLVLSLTDEPFVYCMNYILKNNKNIYSKAFFRIHEDGDFYNMEYFNKWIKIINQNKEIQFEAYTKEKDLLKDITYYNENFENFVLRYSLMADTNKKIIDYVMTNNVYCYVALGSKEEKTTDTEKIYNTINPLNKCVGSCGSCKKCYGKKVKFIYTVLRK